MTVTIDIDPEIEEIAAEQARRDGIGLGEHLANQLARAVIQAEAPTGVGAAGAAERVARFERWAESHERGRPTLPDEAISREAIYGAD